MTAPLTDADLAAMTTAELFAGPVAPLLREIGEINRRNNFAPGRSLPAEDNARSRVLWAAVDRIIAEHDAAHPMPPCPSCGRERRASWGGGCLSFGECPEAPAVMGG